MQTTVDTPEESREDWLVSHGPLMSELRADLDAIPAVRESELDKLCHNCFARIRNHEDWCIYSDKWDEDAPADVIESMTRG
jgi:hypothetical protein